MFMSLIFSKDMPPELVGVSVKDLVKAIGESRANGNGATPPDTPRRQSRSSSPLVSRHSDSRSSSPVPIPGQSCNRLHLRVTGDYSSTVLFKELIHLT